VRLAFVEERDEIPSYIDDPARIAGAADVGGYT
jgi:hypothetical protein